MSRCCRNNVVISPHVYPPTVTFAAVQYGGAGLNSRLTTAHGYLSPLLDSCHLEDNSAGLSILRHYLPTDQLLFGNLLLIRVCTLFVLSEFKLAVQTCLSNSPLGSVTKLSSPINSTMSALDCDLSQPTQPIVKLSCYSRQL